MPYVYAIVAGLAFGALDQYLGTVHVTSRLGWWTITVSGMSAPWLILPFVAGMTQDRARRAVALGFVVVMAALAGYFAMSNGPFEGVPIADFWPRTAAMMRSPGNPLWIVGGAITGPLYGYLGHRWRVARSWVSAVLVTVVLCFEPLARRIVGERLAGGLSGSPVVWTTEVALGVLAALVFLAIIAMERRQRSVAAPTRTGS